MTNFFTTILYQPLFNLLILLVAITPYHNLAVGIILLTILVRLVLFPLNNKAIRSQIGLRDLQPELKAIQDKHKDDKAAQAQATMQFYKDKGISPTGSCLPQLIQLPILLVMYRVFIAGLNGSNLNLVYSFIPHPETIQTTFLWLHNVTKPDPYFILPILAGAAQFFQTKLITPAMPATDSSDTAAIVNKQMLYFTPLFTIIIARTLPAGLSLYWVATSVFAILQQLYIMNQIATKPAKPRVTVRVHSKKG